MAEVEKAIVEVNFTLLKSVFANKGVCICSLTQQCPCKDFVFNKKCKCQTFKVQQ